MKMNSGCLSFLILGYVLFGIKAINVKDSSCDIPAQLSLPSVPVLNDSTWIYDSVVLQPWGRSQAILIKDTTGTIIRREFVTCKCTQCNN